MMHPTGIDLPEQRPIVHFARLQEVVAWPIVPLERITPIALTSACEQRLG
jgi:hypothetical protein